MSLNETNETDAADSTTEHEHSMSYDVSLQFATVAFILIWVLASNGVVILVIRREKRLRTLSNYVIASLALTDFLVAVCVLPLAVYLLIVNDHWPFGVGGCLAWLCLDVFLCTASILHLCSISINRFIAIAYPHYFNQSRKASRDRVLATVGPAWLIGLFTCVPLLIYGALDRSTVLLDVGGGVKICGIFNRPFAACSTVVSFFLPLAVKLTTETRTIYLLHKKAAGKKSALSKLIIPPKNLQWITSPKPIGAPPPITRQRQTSDCSEDETSSSKSKRKKNAPRRNSKLKIFFNELTTMPAEPTVAEVHDSGFTVTQSLSKNSDLTKIPEETTKSTTQGTTQVAVTQILVLEKPDNIAPDKTSTPDTGVAVECGSVESLSARVDHRKSALPNWDSGLKSPSSASRTSSLRRCGSAAKSLRAPLAKIIEIDLFSQTGSTEELFIEEDTRYYSSPSDLLNSPIRTRLDSLTTNDACVENEIPYMDADRCADVVSLIGSSITDVSQLNLAQLSEAAMFDEERSLSYRVKAAPSLRSLRASPPRIKSKQVSVKLTRPTPEITPESPPKDDASRQSPALTLAFPLSSPRLVGNGVVSDDGALSKSGSFAARTLGLLGRKKTASQDNMIMSPLRKQQAAQVRSQRKEKRAQRTLIVVFGCFVLFWSPFFLTNFTYGVCAHCDIPSIVYKVFVWLGWTSSGINPLIYTIFNDDFRKGLRKMIFCDRT